MTWLFPHQSDTSPSRSRLSFLILGLTVLFLLISYQLVLNRELLGSVAEWATEKGFQTVGLDTPGNVTEDEAASLAAGASDSINITVPTSSGNPISSITVAPTETPSASPLPPREKELVLAAMLSSDMSWVDENIPEWYTNIYRADASPEQAELTVPANRGNEAMVFLTYIIDRYDSLPDVALFLHGGRYQWHNDNPLYDSVISIRDLQPAFVREAGYVNLRCTWTIGCPAELEPARYMRERPDDPDHISAVMFPDSFATLFPDIEMPEVVGVPCCSQFALSREKIHERPVEDYIGVRQWLLDSPLDASITGRVFEYSWHIMFGKPSQFCLDPHECFCNTYGYCNMTDEDLEAQWKWRGLVLPEGWPNVTEESNESSQKRSLAPMKGMPDVSDASRRALHRRSVQP